MMNADIHTRLDPFLREMRLPTMRAIYREDADTARRESSTYEEYLFGLVESERQTRHDNRIQRLLKQSRLPLEKTLETFDRGRLPQKVNMQVGTLVDGAFLERRENILPSATPVAARPICCAGSPMSSSRLGAPSTLRPVNCWYRNSLPQKSPSFCRRSSNASPNTMPY